MKHIHIIKGWELFFPIWPRCQDGRIYWLKTVERALVHDSMDGYTYFEYKYVGENVTFSN